MVTPNDIAKRVKVIAPAHKLPAMRADHTGRVGKLVSIRRSSGLPNCLVLFNHCLAGGFLPEELEVYGGDDGR